MLLYPYKVKEVQKAGFGVQLNNGKGIGSLLLAYDFVGINNLSGNLLKLTDVALYQVEVEGKGKYAIKSVLERYCIGD